MAERTWIGCEPSTRPRCEKPTRERWCATVTRRRSCTMTLAAPPFSPSTNNNDTCNGSEAHATSVLSAIREGDSCLHCR